MTTATFDIMGVDERSAAQRVELTVLREFGLLIGRMAGVAAYLLVVQWRTTEPVVVAFLAVLGALPIISAVSIRTLVSNQRIGK